MIVQEFLQLDQVSSTQDIAKDYLQKLQSASHCVWVQAVSQTAGRGRQGHVWDSAATGNLFLSCGLKINLELDRFASWLPLIAGLSLYDVLVNALNQANPSQSTENRLEFLPQLFLKWPNDLFVKTQVTGASTRYEKVGGVLAEASSKGVVVGWGLNLIHAPKLPMAASIKDKFSIELDSKDIARALSKCFLEAIKDYQRSGTLYLDQVYRRCEFAMAPIWGLSGRVIFANTEGELATATGLDSRSGALRVKLLEGPDTGSEKLVNAGEFRLKF